MSNLDPVIVRREGQVLSVRLNRPEVSNAMDPALLSALSDAFVEATSCGARCLLISAEGQNFCAGADLKAASKAPEQMALRKAFHPVLLGLMSLEIPVVAAVQGSAAGGGLGLALAADIRIMSETARFVPAWVKIGFAPDLGVSWFAPRLLGASRAFDWLTSGRAMSAAEAEALGLASQVVSADVLFETALQRAQMLADQPGLAAPLTKSLISGAFSHGLADQLEAEARAMDKAVAAPGREEAVKARMDRFAKGNAS